MKIAKDTDSWQNEEQYCPICKVSLSGPEPAAQHYSGSKHRKKAAAVRSATEKFVTSREYCSDCHIYCDTFQQLQIHKQSPSHLAKAEIDGDSTGSSSDYYSTGGIDGVFSCTN